MFDDLKSQAADIDIEAGITGSGSQGEPEQKKDGEYIPAEKIPTMEGARGAAEMILTGGAFGVAWFTKVNCPDEVLQDGVNKLAPVLLKRFPKLCVIGESSPEAEFGFWLVGTGVMIYQEMNKDDIQSEKTADSDTSTKQTNDNEKQAPAKGSIYEVEASRVSQGKVKND